MHDLIKLEPGKFYHIFNRGNNHGVIFFEERNYAYFLDRYKKYISGIADTFAYCLLGNHFHLLLRLRETESIAQHSSSTQSALNSSKPFSDFFNCYTRSINKAYSRSGGLFEGPFGRIEVSTEEYLIQLLLYIHLNPQSHGIVSDFANYPHSSYHLLSSEEDTFLNKDEVLRWFGSKASFIKAHLAYRDEDRIQQLIGNDR